MRILKIQNTIKANNLTNITLLNFSKQVYKYSSLLQPSSTPYKNFNSKSNLNLFFNKTSNKSFSFEQTKEKQKRHFMLIYKFVEDMHYKRIPYREEHLKLIEKLEAQGVIIIGGSFFPNDGACLIFTGLDELIVDGFVKKDPYYKKGLVKEYEIKEIEMHTKKRADELALYYKYR